jgi:hypothetical protein
MPTSFLAALIALGLQERAFAWVFVGIATFALVYAVGFLSYFA